MKKLQYFFKTDKKVPTYKRFQSLKSARSHYHNLNAIQKRWYGRPVSEQEFLAIV